MAVRNRVKDRATGGFGILQLGFPFEDFAYPVRNFIGQRDLDENQRFIFHRRVEERVAITVGRLEAAAQLGPALDFVHRLVGDDLFQDMRRRGPVDRLHQQEAAVEPGVEQVTEIGVDPVQFGVFTPRVQQAFAHLHQSPGAPRGQVDAPQQLLPPRLGSCSQAQQVLRAAVIRVGIDRLSHSLDIDIVVGQQQGEEREAHIIVEFFERVQDAFGE